VGACAHDVDMREDCVMAPRIEPVHGDITAQDTDAVVNAANT
jgi:hypothetical protein